MFGGLFGGGDNGSDKAYKSAQAALAKVEPMLRQTYQPYMDYGMRAMPQLEEQYQAMLNNPGQYQDLFGGGYEQSPGFQFQMDSAMNAANMAAAAGGGLGGSAHQMQAMGAAQGLTNQDYWNYYNQNKDVFNRGLTGTEGQFNTGFNAAQGYAGGMGNLYGSQANLAFGQGASNAANNASLWGAGLGAAGSILGGPMGGQLGKAIGGWF